MKIRTKILLIALTLAAPTGSLLAQDAGTPPPDHQRPPRNAGGPGEPRRGGGSPVIAALDVNRDGIIDATELANAPAALKALDRSGNGALEGNEFAPTRPDAGGHRPPPPDAPPQAQASNGDTSEPG